MSSDSFELPLNHTPKNLRKLKDSATVYIQALDATDALDKAYILGQQDIESVLDETPMCSPLFIYRVTRLERGFGAKCECLYRWDENHWSRIVKR